MHEKFKISRFWIDPDDNTISCDGVTRHVEPKAMQVLLLLVEQAEKTVSRQYLLETAWGNRVVVDEALTRVISQLRGAFEDSKTRTLIQTVPKKGYRLNANIIVGAQGADIEDAEVTESDNLSHSHRSDHDITGSVSQQTDYDETPSTPEEQAEAPVVAADSTDSSARKHWKTGILLVEVLCVLVLIILWFTSPSSDSSKPETKSVAVLPLQAVGNNSQTEYLAQGLSDELQGALSGSKGLRVSSRYSTFTQAANFSSPADIATALNVQFLIEGTVSEQDSAYKVVYRLIDAHKDETLWSHSYEGDAITLPQITQNAAQRVQQYLQPDTPRLHSASEPGTNTTVDAYRAYMRGKYWLMNGKTSEWFMQASAAFTESIEADPDYAQAYGSLAYIYARYNFHDTYLDTEAASKKASWAISKALAIDANERNALLATAILSTAEQAYQKAESALDKVLEQNERDSTALYLYSELRLAQNRYDDALKLALDAKKADPLSPWVNVNLAIVSYYRGEYSQALQAANDAIDVDNSYTWAYVWKAKALLNAGRVKEAIENMQACLKIDNASPVNTAFTGLLYLELDLPEQAHKYFRQTATLFGDSVDARLWKGFLRFGYHQQDTNIGSELLIQSRLLDNRVFSLMPLLTSLYSQQNLFQEGAEQIATRFDIKAIKTQRVNYLNRHIIAAYRVLASDRASSDLPPERYQQINNHTAVVYRLLAAQQQQSDYREELERAAQNGGWWPYLWVLNEMDTIPLPGAVRQYYQQLLQSKEQQRQQVSQGQ